MDKFAYFKSESGIFLPHGIRTVRRPIAMDFFSGCGGMSLGLIKAGFDVIAAIEWDPAAIQTYLVNLGAYPVKMVFIEPKDQRRMEIHLQKQIDHVMRQKPDFSSPMEAFRCGGIMSGTNRHHVCPEFSGVKYMFVGDIRNITGEQIMDVVGLEPGELDLIAGGPPCQGFSTSGKQNIMDPRNSLVFEFAKLIVEIKPKTMLFENVPGILDMTTPEGIPVMDAFCKILTDGDYGNYDALRKSLMASAGCGAALKNAKGTRKGMRNDPEPAPRQVLMQGSLF